MNSLSTLVIALCAIGVISLSASSAAAQPSNDPIVIIEGGLFIIDDYRETLSDITNQIVVCEDYVPGSMFEVRLAIIIALQDVQRGTTLIERIILEAEGKQLDETVPVQDTELTQEEIVRLLNSAVNDIHASMQGVIYGRDVQPGGCVDAQVQRTYEIVEYARSGVQIIENGLAQLSNQQVLEVVTPSTIVVIPPRTDVPGCENAQECYVPYNMRVTPGSTVTWVNSDDVGHTVTAGTPDAGPAEDFYSPLIATGETYEFTFNNEGTYEYFCLIHQWMRGTVEVSTGIAYADESEAILKIVVPDLTVDIPEGTAEPGCEDSNECYLPYVAEVNAGDTIQWINSDPVPHTVTAGSPDDGATGQFYSSLLLQNDTFEHTFDEPGTYDYYCLVHPWMLGSVQVN